MSKKKSHPSTSASKSPAAAKTSNKLKEAKDAKRFFIVLAIATLLLVAFLYFILIGSK
jgi:hypothetical protein